MMKPRRLIALMAKEALQIRRDPSSLYIAFALPLVLLLLIGFGVSLDAKDIRMAVVLEQSTPKAQSLVAAFRASPFFVVDEVRLRQDAEAGLISGQYRAALLLANDFESRLNRGAEAPIQVLLDGTDANTARLAKGYVEGVWAKWLAYEARSAAQSITLPISVESRVWFNPALESRHFLIPGLIAIIMTLTGTILTALVVAREWERGTMEALIATPVGRFELLVGKLAPYFVLGMGGMALSVLVGMSVYDVPFRGSWWVLTLCSALYMACSLAMGLLISTIAKNQFVAGQVALIAAFLPAFMLSGFVFEPSSMPLPIELLSRIVAARYFVTILQTLFLAGDVWSVIWPNSLALLAIATFFLALTWKRTRKSLE
ncbi:MAG: ABC transporter permease [Magnetospirillum sp.]